MFLLLAWCFITAKYAYYFLFQPAYWFKNKMYDCWNVRITFELSYQFCLTMMPCDVSSPYVVVPSILLCFICVTSAIICLTLPWG